MSNLALVCIVVNVGRQQKLHEDNSILARPMMIVVLSSDLSYSHFIFGVAGGKCSSLARRQSLSCLLSIGSQIEVDRRGWCGGETFFLSFSLRIGNFLLLLFWKTNVFLSTNHNSIMGKSIDLMGQSCGGISCDQMVDLFVYM